MKTRVLIISALLIVAPGISLAQVGSDTGADMQCIPAKPTPCPCGMELQGSPPKCQPTGNKFMCQCQQTDNGFTTSGLCLADQKCHAMSTGGKSPDQGLSQLGQMLGQLMQQLMKAGQGGGSGGGSGSPTGTGLNGSAGCTTYTPTSDPTQVGKNPCVYYVPSTSGSSGGVGTPNTTSANDLLNALNGAGETGIGTGSGGAGTGTTIPIGTPTGGSTTTTGGNATPAAPSPALSQQILTNIGSLPLGGTAAPQQQQSFSGIPGVVGNILFNNNGATIFASTVNPSSNSAVAGFYGADNGTQGVVSSMCQNRPWASNFLSGFIPPTFFDGLCQWGGYQVGKPPVVQTQQPQVSLTQQPQRSAQPAQSAATTTATSTGPFVPPSVLIWAVPQSAPLGTRTSIFWKTQGVTNCTETSPDGSFSQNSLQGAGATVPITAATTFTISCLDMTGKPVSSYVTVNLKI